jgi:hypothetical protein
MGQVTKHDNLCYTIRDETVSIKMKYADLKKDLKTDPLRPGEQVYQIINVTKEFRNAKPRRKR